KDRLIQKLGACDFRQIKKDQNKLGLSMILGGCGATLEEMTGLYSIFSNGGKYVPPIYTLDGSAMGSGPAKGSSSQKPPAFIPRSILSSAATFMINETLSKVNRPDFPLNWTNTVHLPKIAWKTGTSYGRRDAWSIGYNKKFTVGIW